MKNILSFTLAFLSFTAISFGQFPGMGSGGGGNMKEMAEKMKIGRFYGKVVDSTTNKAVEFASVQLIGAVYDTATKQLRKDAVVAGQLTQENGDFSLDKLNVMGKYRLKISALGYAVKEIPVSFNFDMEKMKSGGGGAGAMSMLNAVDKDLGNIKIAPLATQLKTVEVVATAPTMELKLDKKVFTVDKNLMSAGGTAEDVLKQVPSVNVDMDGNVTMRNAAPEIFVDGKPTTLTIDQIPAEAIEKIEVITNPSAKYDAAGGQAGILNIVLKKDKRLGYNGSIRMGVDQRGKGNAGGDLNVREGKINAFVSGNVNQRYSITEGETERNNLTGTPTTNIFQDQHSVSDGLFMHSRGGVDYFMNNRNTFTLSGNYVRGSFDPVDELDTKTDTVYPIYTNSTSYRRVSKTYRRFQNAGGSLQYKHLFPKEGQELTADFNYNKSSFVAGGDYSTNYFDGDGDPVGGSILQMGESEGHTEILSGQADYIHPITDKSKWESGIRFSNRNYLSLTDNYMMNDSTDEFEIITNQSTHYKFNDRIYAGYLIYSKQISKISYQVGLRGESSFYTGELIDSNKTFKNYFPISLFPSISSTYEINKNNNFQLAISRRINRPTFFQLLPFTDYSDSLNLKRGNAGLKPEFTNSAELSYLHTFSQGNNLLASTYFKYSTDGITSYQVMEYDTVLDKMAIISTYENTNSSYVYGGEITSKHTIKKWLEFSINVNAYYSYIDAKNIEDGLTNERFSWFTKGNVTIKFPKNISFQISPDYKSRTAVPASGGGGGRFGGPTGGMGGQGWMGGNSSSAQGYTEARFALDLALKYEFMKNKAASINLSVRDILGTDINTTITESEYFYQKSVRLRDARLFRINFSYRFGKFDASLFKRKNMKMNTDGMEMGM